MKPKTPLALPPLLDTEHLKIGEYYVVKKSDESNEKYIAQLIEMKELTSLASQAEAGGEGPASLMGNEEQESPKSPNDFHYYIHYDGMDRRLDEWVERSRFVANALPPELCTIDAQLQGVENAAPLSSTALTRSQRRIHEEFHHQQASMQMDAEMARLEKEHEERTKVRTVDKIVLNGFLIDSWYWSPYPYQNTPVLRVCDYCLSYTDNRERMGKHKATCVYRCPPGDEIYRDGDISLYEVMGLQNKTYCQSLCLLSKLFLDHKTLYFDVDTFVFYVLCEVSPSGAHIIGHFSKELHSVNNLACIMVLPPYQRKGYGKLLIQISYELSRREDRIGTPEKPLSDLGKVSYRSYWWWRLLEVLDKHQVEEMISAGEVEAVSRVAQEDIVATLKTMNMVKYWKGGYVVRAFRRDIEHCKSLGMAKPPKLMMKADNLKWWPRSNEQSSGREKSA